MRWRVTCESESQFLSSFNFFRLTREKFEISHCLNKIHFTFQFDLGKILAHLRSNVFLSVTYGATHLSFQRSIALSFCPKFEPSIKPAIANKKTYTPNYSIASLKLLSEESEWNFQSLTGNLSPSLWDQKGWKKQPQICINF